MKDTFDAEQKKRLIAFQVTDADLELLREQTAFAQNKLPALLERLHESFAGWPETQKTLRDPDVHSIRVEHWIRVVSGRIGEGYMESAKRLASAFYQNGVPSYAVAICHATVSNGIIKELDLDAQASGFGGKGKMASKAALRSALNKLAWLDLEVLLETYTTAERESKQTVMNDLANVFENKIRVVVDGVSRS